MHGHPISKLHQHNTSLFSTRWANDNLKTIHYAMKALDCTTTRRKTPLGKNTRTLFPCNIEASAATAHAPSSRLKYKDDTRWPHVGHLRTITALIDYTAVNVMHCWSVWPWGESGRKLEYVVSSGNLGFHQHAGIPRKSAVPSCAEENRMPSTHLKYEQSTTAKQHNTADKPQPHAESLEASPLVPFAP